MVKMYKRRHSLRTTTVVVDEKRSKRWTQCFSLKNLQKLAAATGLCCYKPKTSQQTSVRPHPTLRRANTECSSENSYRLSKTEDNFEKDATLSSRESDVSLCSRVDYVQKSIECPLNDAQLQRDITRVVERLNYLLNLADNGNGPSNSFTECNELSCASTGNPANREAHRHIPFKASWDENSTSLCIKLVPPSQTSTNCCGFSHSEQFDNGFSCSQTKVLPSGYNGTPYILHRRLSARISADSGFFNHQNDVMNPTIESSEEKDKEKRPVSPHTVKATSTAKTKTSVLRRLTTDFKPVSDISGIRVKNANRDIVKKWRKLPMYGVLVGNENALAEELQQIDCWGGVDLFKVAKLSNNRPLTCVMYTICQKRDMFNKFKLQPDKFLTYLMTLEDHYRDVPYHNRIHAADVAQSVHSLLSIPSLKDLFSDLEVLSALIASAMHDVDHRGVSNQYHTSNYTELAMIYNDTSVLEMHHLAVGFKLMMQEHCNVFENFSTKQWQLFRKMVVDMVLATDMSKHMQLVANLKTMVETKKVASSGVLELDQYIDRIEVLKNLVHCADLSNPIKPLEFYQQWTNRIMEEYWVQGDIEREMGSEISPMCDRHTANVEKSQVMFIDFVVYPLVEIWAELVNPHAQEMLNLLTHNREHYANLMPGSPSPSGDKEVNVPISNWDVEKQPVAHDSDSPKDSSEYYDVDNYDAMTDEAITKALFANRKDGSSPPPNSNQSKTVAEKEAKL